MLGSSVRQNVKTKVACMLEQNVCRGFFESKVGSINMHSHEKVGLESKAYITKAQHLQSVKPWERTGKSQTYVIVFASYQ